MDLAQDIVKPVMLGLWMVFVLSGLARLASATFSPRVRLSIRQRPALHSIWLGGSILSIAILMIILIGVKDYARRHAEKIKHTSTTTNTPAQ